MEKSEKIIKNLLAIADIKINGNRPWDIQIHNPKFYSRVLSGGRLASGESYMDGWWDAKALDQFFYKIMIAHLDRKIITPSIIFNGILSKMFNIQSKKRSTKVAKEHYDLGNDFYEKMLGKTMQYTCAYWKNAKTLDKAQTDKLDLICRKLQLKKNDNVLELGCGWGMFAKYAAEKYGCKITSLNISKEQVAYARKICEGLPVTVLHTDYRNAKGKFDKVVAIGLAEHIGHKNYRNFMKIGYRSLKKNGIFFIHTIGRNKSVTLIDPWHNKYIFANSMIPSAKQLGKAMDGLFVLEDWHNFGVDYDKTLMEWYHNFDRNWSKFKKKYDNCFYRMWKYYLLSSAGAFRARHINLWQIVLSKDGIPKGYNSIR